MAQFTKGQSGNPAGRPKKSKNIIDIERLCRDNAQKAIDRLLELMASENETIALKACQIVLDRGYGKPRMSIEQTEVVEPPALVVTFTDSNGNELDMFGDKRKIEEKESVQ